MRMKTYIHTHVHMAYLEFSANVFQAPKHMHSELTSVCKRVCICVCVCVNMRVRVYIYVCIYDCMLVCVYAHTFVYTSKCIVYVNVHGLMRTCMHSLEKEAKNAHAHMYIFRVYMHTHMFAAVLRN